MSQPVRLGLFYAALFVGTGASSPYIPVWFASRGLSGAEIGLILSAPMFARAVTAPAIAMWADSFHLRRTPLILMGLATALAYGLLAAPFGFAWWFGIWFIANTILSTMIPLTDVIVFGRARREGFNYGWPRGIGSVAFIIANVTVGLLLARFSPELVLVWITAAAMLAAAGARGLLPPDPVREGGAASRLSERLAGLSDLLRDKNFMLAVVSVGLIQSAHAFYYSFSALSWKQQGLPESATGLLWGLAVGVEVAFMWFMEPWRRRIGPRNLLMIGGCAALVRWIVLSFAPPLWVVLPMQALHTFTYAATFLASLQLVERLSTPANASAAQTINSALSGGLLMGAATIGSGWLFDAVGTWGYLAMAAMSALGLVGALRLYGVRRLDA
ncbi:MFS transporter [Phenylobacterium sp.]|uniref:MFS transporter n=1 Tax=Phenylobacterium sp. TaxID=1871053 RepID=UPI00272F7E12|nr:MFS transporter [Phenylobacterium sp.]MDP1598769.1 MFS transporter [Phenylobacterium sp.]MDP3590639.1 MFS transporter [Phenylobacterium sp.]